MKKHHKNISTWTVWRDFLDDWSMVLYLLHRPRLDNSNISYYLTDFLSFNWDIGSKLYWKKSFLFGPKPRTCIISSLDYNPFARHYTIQYQGKALQKRFYNRVTIAVLNYEIYQMYLKPPFPSLLCNSNNESKNLSQSWERGWTLSQWRNPYKGDCFSIVMSLLALPLI